MSSSSLKIRILDSTWFDLASFGKLLENGNEIVLTSASEENDDVNKWKLNKVKNAIAQQQRLSPSLLQLSICCCKNSVDTKETTVDDKKKKEGELSPDENNGSKLDEKQEKAEPAETKTTSIQKVQSIQSSVEKVWNAQEAIENLCSNNNGAATSHYFLGIEVDQSKVKALVPNRLSISSAASEDTSSFVPFCVSCGKSIDDNEEKESTASASAKSPQKPAPKGKQQQNDASSSKNSPSAPSGLSLFYELPCGHLVHRKQDCFIDHKRNLFFATEEQKQTMTRCSYCLSLWTYQWKKISSSTSSKKDDKNTKTSNNNNNNAQSKNNTRASSPNNNSQQSKKQEELQASAEEYIRLPWCEIKTAADNNNDSGGGQNISSSSNSLSLSTLNKFQRCQLEGVNCQNKAVATCETHRSAPPCCEQHMKERHSFPECKRKDIVHHQQGKDSSSLFRLFGLPCPNPDHRRAERRYFDRDYSIRKLVCSYCKEEDEQQQQQQQENDDNNNNDSVNQKQYLRYDDGSLRDFAEKVHRIRSQSSQKFFNETASKITNQTLDFYSKIKTNQQQQLSRLESYSTKVQAEIDRQYSCTKQILENQMKKLEEEYKLRKSEATEQFEKTKAFLNEGMENEKVLEPLEKILRQSTEVVNTVARQLSLMNLAKSIHPSLLLMKAESKNSDNSDENGNVDRESDSGAVFPDFVLGSQKFFSSTKEENASKHEAEDANKNQQEDTKKEEEVVSHTPSFSHHCFISRPVPQLFGFSTFVGSTSVIGEREASDPENLSSSSPPPPIGITEERAKKYLEKYQLQPVFEIISENEKKEEEDQTQSKDKNDPLLTNQISEVEWVLHNFRDEGYFLDRTLEEVKENEEKDAHQEKQKKNQSLLACRPLGNIFEGVKTNVYSPLLSIDEMKKLFVSDCWNPLNPFDDDDETTTVKEETSQEQKEEEKEAAAHSNNQKKSSSENDEASSSNQLLLEEKIEDIDESEILNEEDVNHDEDKSKNQTKNTQSSVDLQTKQNEQEEAKEIESEAEEEEEEEEEENVKPVYASPYPPSSSKGNKGPDNKNNIAEKTSTVDNTIKASATPVTNSSNKNDTNDEEENILRSQIMSLVNEEKDCLSKLRCWIVAWHEKSYQFQVFHEIIGARQLFRQTLPPSSTRMILSCETMQIVEDWYVDYDLRNAVLKFAENRANAVRSNATQQLMIVRQKLNDFGI